MAATRSSPGGDEPLRGNVVPLYRGVPASTVAGPVRPGRKTKLLVKHLHRGDIALVDHLDIDRVSAEELIVAGATAVLQADNVTLVVTSRPVHLYDRSLFLAHGLDPRQFDLVVVKSPHCQPHMYADWCARLINVDAPGSTSANLPTLGHTRCRRPIFPLDRDVPFAPQARLFSRQN